MFCAGLPGRAAVCQPLSLADTSDFFSSMETNLLLELSSSIHCFLMVPACMSMNQDMLQRTPLLYVYKRWEAAASAFAFLIVWFFSLGSLACRWNVPAHHQCAGKNLLHWRQLNSSWSFWKKDLKEWEIRTELNSSTFKYSVYVENEASKNMQQKSMKTKKDFDIWVRHTAFKKHQNKKTSV